jgi:hypothetical protein
MSSGLAQLLQPKPKASARFSLVSETPPIVTPSESPTHGPNTRATPHMFKHDNNSLSTAAAATPESRSSPFFEYSSRVFSYGIPEEEEEEGDPILAFGKTRAESFNMLSQLPSSVDAMEDSSYSFAHAQSSSHSTSASASSAAMHGLGSSFFLGPLDGDSSLSTLDQDSGYHEGSGKDLKCLVMTSTPRKRDLNGSCLPREVNSSGFLFSC